MYIYINIHLICYYTLKSCFQHMVFSCLFNQFRRRCSTTSSTAHLRRLRRRHLRHTSYGTLHRRCFGIRLSLMGAFGSKMIMRIDTDRHGSLNVPIEHHPTIRYMVYNGYYKVMSNIPKMGHLPTPDRYSKGVWIVTTPTTTTSIGISFGISIGIRSISIISISIIVIALRVWCLDTSWK